MNLLGAALYDPGTAATKATSSLLAMTAFDTTNLRLAITVPAHGLVRFRMRCAITGATTSPTILLGVMNGATVLGRVAPTYENATANATSQNFLCDAEFTVTGLTPGAMNVDAAYAVQVVVASTNIKYGGPNNNSGANAWGAFVFEAWDPRPVPTAAPGAANGLFIAGTNAATSVTTGLTANITGNVSGSVGSVTGAVGSVTGAVGSVTGAVGSVTGNVGGNVVGSVASVTARVTANTDQLAGQTVTAAAGVTFPTSVASPTNITGGTITTVTNLTNAPTAGDLTATMKASVTTAATAATPTAAAVTGAVGSVTGAVGSVTGNVGGNVVGSVGSVTGAVGSVTGLTASDVGSIKTTLGAAGAGLTALGDTRLANLDAAVSTRSTLAAGAAMTLTVAYDAAKTAATQASVNAIPTAPLLAVNYTAPPSAAAIRTEIDLNSIGLAAIFARTDVATSSRLAAASYTAPDNASVTAIKAKTDSLAFTTPGLVDTNLQAINDQPVTGTGAPGNLFGV